MKSKKINLALSLTLMLSVFLTAHGQEASPYALVAEGEHVELPNDSSTDYPYNPYALINKGERIELTSESSALLVDEAEMKRSVCYDRAAFKENKEILAKFDRLQEANIIDELGCSKDVALNDEDGKDLFIILASTISSESNPMKIVAVRNENTGTMEVVLTNSEDEEFAKKNALTTRDKIEIAGLTITSTIIGALVERKMFPGEHDKLLHRNVGAIINIAGNLAAYSIIERLGVGNALKLTRKQRKLAILLTGSLLGAAAGWGKERFYDYYRQKNHTYDPKLKGDMGATMLGGGAMTPLLLTLSLAF